MNVVRFKGGLGNQMFQYAFLLALKKEHPFFIYLISVDSSVNKHCGFELTKIFSISVNCRKQLFSFFNGCFPFLSRSLRYLNPGEQNALAFDKAYLTKRRSCYYYDGYWQSELFFKDIEEKIREKFTFDSSILNDLTRKAAEIITKQNAVAVHIRRGDYLMEVGWDTCDIGYYKRALTYIHERDNNIVVYIFSDDIKWCREQFCDSEYVFVDWNNGEDSWQDMFLMSKCKHNIIANSSFSWWGAWLNTNPNKIVIAPNVWFKGREKEDIVPLEWIRL